MDYYSVNEAGCYKWRICETCMSFKEDPQTGEHCAVCEYPSIPTSDMPISNKPTNYAPVVHERPSSRYGTIEDWMDEVRKAIGSEPDDNYDWVLYSDVEKNIEKEAGFDPVSHPSHYTEGRQYEPRKVIHDWGLNFNLGNAVKYISRAGRKGDALEDLKKARQYLDFEIEEMEKEDK